jgi:hypothetical protein
MIIHTHQKSKKKRTKKKDIQQYQEWLASVNSMTTGFSKTPVTRSMPKYQTPKVPENRSTKNIPSLQTIECDTSAKPTKVYTGDKMIGIGTLHKSNAVPIFRKEDAKDQANMRR